MVYIVTLQVRVPGILPEWSYIAIASTESVWSTGFKTKKLPVS